MNTRFVRSFTFFVFSLFICAALAGAADSPVGKWKTFDDETGKPKSIVRVYAMQDGTLAGKLDSLLPWPGKSPDRVCDKCSGERKGKPMRGMIVLWGMRLKGSLWEGGHILDPNNGKTYRCRMTLDSGGRILTVRGYLGISLLGRSQKWERME